MARHDTAWFDAQYNNRARVPEAAVLLGRWAEASALARSQTECRLDLRYGSEAGETLDLFPAAAPNAPVLVFIHGGYWRALDKSDHSFVAPVFTDEGALVVVPNYALCPAVSMERIALQIAQALAWVWRHAHEHGGDSSRIVVVGHSAGGHLAAMMSCCDWKAVGAELPRDLVKGAMSLSGLHDLAPLMQTPFLQKDLRLDADAVKRLSPVRFPAPESPLFALVGGDESEEFKRQNLAIREAWGARAVPVCEEVPGCHHFNVLHELCDPDSRVHRMARHLLGLRWHSGLL
ncbi:alpha/beta hydrolase [Pelomonas sp. SE-A7]|uniref:alpha/beta hydrolase n=1 Tax=Pelomonas sp. SE-A7 TaxID=3054953 RepID=UPI00259CA3DE|nr:alpha/beta hydrolase [Pelomonas sp. SE-A7]MDM4764764.1 alpha/beta hydrolase [Pelomonas sp. SE-A7]